MRLTGGITETGHLEKALGFHERKMSVANHRSVYVAHFVRLKQHTKT